MSIGNVSRYFFQVDDAFGGDYIVPKEVFEVLLRAAASSVAIDGVWYLNRHPDVAEAVKQGHVLDAADHYIRFGFREGRQPYPIKVDEAYYLAANSDVVDAIKKGAFVSAQEHFNKNGFAEGRAPYSGFNFILGGGV